jgi:hypothetical protein
MRPKVVTTIANALTGWLTRQATRSLLKGRTFRLLGTMLQSGIPLLELSGAQVLPLRGLTEPLSATVLERDVIASTLESFSAS